jgi:hypothetical protein
LFGGYSADEGCERDRPAQCGFLAGRREGLAMTELRATAATFARGTNYKLAFVALGLVDLFTDDKIDEALALLSASLDDVDIMELLEQVREI